jgi:hypothetical protein
MIDEEPAREEVFVVRFWPDRTRAQDNAWRGCVDHVLTGQRQFFVELPALTAFVAACLNEASTHKTSQKL